MCSTAYSPVLRKRQCVLMIFDFRPHRMHRIHAHYCNRRRTFRGLSVCLCWARRFKPRKISWADRDAVWQQIHVHSRNRVLDGRAHWRHLANTIKRSVHGGSALRPYAKLLWPLVALLHVLFSNWPTLIIFGMLNPEKIWHEHLTDLSTSPVSLPSEIQKVIFQHYYSYTSDYLR